MNPKVRNVLAVVVGIVVGSIVNMALVTVSGYIIPPPEGADMSTMEGLKASLPLFEPRHFIMPFLAHALGTFAGAIVAILMATGRYMRQALAVGLWFLIGGIANTFMLPSPAWYTVIDLTLAYIPFAYIGARLINKNAPTTSAH